MQNSPPSDGRLDARLRLIVESYQRLTGKALIPRYTAQSAALGETTSHSTRLHNAAAKSLVIGTVGNEKSDIAALRDALWNVPRAIVAHGTEDDPIFFYGNRLALQLFEMSFEEFTRLPSRLSAEPLAQEAREKLLGKVTRQGYVDGYSGMRIAKSGKRFVITDTTVWNLVDERGLHQGQAAAFVEQQV